MTLTIRQWLCAFCLVNCTQDNRMSFCFVSYTVWHSSNYSFAKACNVKMHAGILQSDLVAESNTVAIALYESIRNHIQLAYRAVDQQQFQESIMHYESAISEVNQELLAVIFAHRAQCYEKMEQYDLMLSDAKRVSECLPTSAHGYIQTARALHHKQELRDAYLTYDAGLKAVSPDDPLYQTLISLKDSLAAEISQRNFSLLGRLPCDVFDQIFSQLSVIERTKRTMTCKSWKSMLLNWGNMWKTVDIKCIEENRVLDCIKRIDGRNVRELSIDLWLGNENGNVLNALAQNGYNQLQVLGNMFAFLIAQFLI